MKPVEVYLQGLRELKAPGNPLNSINVNNNEFKKRAEEFEHEAFLYESEQFITSEQYEDDGDGGDPKKIITEQEPVETPLPSPTPTLTQTPTETPAPTPTETPAPTLTQTPTETPAPTPTLTQTPTETPIPTYNLYFGDEFTSITGEPSLSANEGNYRYFVLATTNVSPGTIIPYTITGISQEDINVLLNDTLTIDYGGGAALGFTIAEDLLTEGPETLIVTIDGITPTVSAALVINDTSTTPTYNLRFTNLSEETITTTNENEPVYIVLTTTKIATDASIPFTITGISQSDLENSLTQNFFLSSFDELTDTCVWVNTIRPLPDFLTEGSETMVVTLDGITPTVSAALVINDTSITL